MTVWALVVHRDQPRRCAETVAALRRQEVDLRIVVVDNASSPANLAEVLAIPGVEVIETGSNRGFGGGANAGLRAWLNAGAGEWAVVLPHDAQPEPDCLRRMLAAVAERSRAGLASAEYGQDELPMIDPYLGALTTPAARGEGWAPADFAHGTFLLVRRACIESVGLFDETYFAYCEEADLALRARRAGWEVGMVWGAVVENPHQGTPAAAIDYLMVRNTILLVRRHFGPYRATLRFLFAVFSTAWLAARPTARTPWFDTRARCLALRDVALGRGGAPPVRLLRR